MNRLVAILVAAVAIGAASDALAMMRSNAINPDYKYGHPKAQAQEQPADALPAKPMKKHKTKHD